VMLRSILNIYIILIALRNVAASLKVHTRGGYKGVLAFSHEKGSPQDKLTHKRGKF